MKIEITCNHCGAVTERERAYVNKAKRDGYDLYCNKTCSGLGRRIHKTEAQKKEEKRLYDQEYRKKNLAMLKKKKSAYFQRTYDPVKAAIVRKKGMPAHVEYCRSLKYKKWKKEYDKKYRAKKDYGEFWESHLILKEIEPHIDKYEAAIINQILNKTQKRKRHEKINSRKFEERTLGNISISQRR